MTITRVNPAGWSLGDKLTSAQQNQLDIDHANALDKTSAGDTLSGVVRIQSGGQLLGEVGGAFFATAAGAIETGVPRALVSGAVGAISLEGGPTDFPACNPPRSRSVAIVPQVPALASGWTLGGALTNSSLIGSATSTIQHIYMPGLHNGATLTSITMSMIVASHTGVPAIMPLVQVEITNLLTGAQSLVSGGAVPTPATGAAWTAGGALQTFTIGGLGFVVDTTQNVYTLILVDENGSNSVAGNQYLGFVLNYTGIADLRFAA